MRLLFLIALLFSILPVLAQQAPAQPILKIGMFKDFVPYSFVDSKGQAQGFMIDYWRLWAKKVNRQIEFVPLSLPQVKVAFEQNKIQMHIGFFKREQDIGFAVLLNSFYKTTAHVYVKKYVKNKISQMSDLNGKTIGVFGGIYYDIYIQKHFPHIKVKPYASLDAMVQAVENGSIDAFLNESVTTWFQMIKHLNFNQYEKLPDFRLTNEIHAVVTKKEPVLQALVSQGMKRISINEITELENIWIVNEDLRTSALTKSEQLWLQTHPDITIATAYSWHPFIFVNSNGQTVGYNVDLLATINKNLGTNIKTKRFRYWQDGLKALVDDKIDGIFSLSWSQERAKLLNYSPPYYFDPHKIFVREDNLSIKSFEDIKNQRIAVVKEYVITALLKTQFPDAKFVYIKDYEEAFEAIDHGEADVALFGTSDPKLLTRYNLKIVGSYYSKAGEFAIGSSKNNPVLSSILAKGINSITPLQHEQLLNKWHKQPPKNSSIFNKAELQYIKNHPDISVGVELWQPIIFSDGKEIFGIVGDLLRQISKISGLKFKPEVNEWDNLLTDFKQQKIDLLPSSFFTTQRQQFGLFGDNFLNINSALYVLNTSSVKRFDDLSGRKVAAVKGGALLESITTKFPDITIVPTINIDAAITLLLNGQVDALFGVEAVISYILKDSLIDDVKLLKQQNMPERGLYFWSAKDQPLLQSILMKSMNNIPQQFKDKTTARWMPRTVLKNEIMLAFGLGRDPFTLDKGNLKGIEFDLLKKIFDAAEINITATKKLPLAMLPDALKNSPQLDGVVTVKKQQDGFFYSTDFIHFNNIVVSLAQNDFSFTALSDLHDKKVMAFSGALQDLGATYKEALLTSKGSGTYLEISNQEQQLNALISGEVEVIIIDKTILRWLVSQIGYNSLEHFKFHDILTSNINPFKVAFRSRQLRDTFNHGLAELKKTGEYQHIIDDYALAIAPKKMALTSLISAILAPFIFDEDNRAIKLISNKFGLLPYINKIEIFNNNSELLHQSTSEEFKFYKQFDTFDFVNNAIKKVGFIRVFFNDKEVKKQLISANLIPQIEFFNQHPFYPTIYDVYQSFDYLTQKIEFSLQEKIYLKSQPLLRYSKADWIPLSIVKGNHFSGFIADYMNIIAEKTGIKFEFNKFERWQDIIEAFKNNQLDYIPGVSNLEEFRTMGLLSDEFAYIKFVIVMDGESTFVSDTDDLKDMTIAVPTDNSSYYFVKEKYPNAKIIDAKNIHQALTMVRDGRADAFIEHLAVATNQLENDFSDLRIVGLLDYGYSHRMMVKSENTILIGIINKVIAAIPQEKHQEIYARWIKREINTAVDYRVLYQLVAAFIFILIIILIVFRKFAAAKNEVERAHQELERSFDNLQQAQLHLVESEKMAGLGGLVAGIAHEINTPVGIGLTAITNLMDLTETLDQKYKAKKMSQIDFETYLQSSIVSAQIINRNLEKTAELVRSFKQISVDQSSDEQRTFNVQEYIDEIKLSIFHLTKKSNITISVSCDETLEITSYPGAFSQILSNFLINSTIHAYPDHQSGEISIKIEVVEQAIQLTYTDDGAGIADKHLAKIFDPFFTTNREGGGSGLGLNIIYNIVRNRLKGKITCNSELGKYTTFVVNFSPARITDDKK